MASDAGTLLCPVCSRPHRGTERFCADCGIPLVHARIAEAEPASERHAMARKIKPQFSEGELVRVAGARNLTEAEFIQGLLLEEGVPSMLRRTAGFDVPDFLAAGPRDVLVPAAGALTARQVLLEAEIVPAGMAAASPIAAPGRLLAGLLAALAVGVLVVWLLTRALGL